MAMDGVGGVVRCTLIQDFGDVKIDADSRIGGGVLWWEVGVTEEDANLLVAASKTIAEPIVWMLTNARRQRYRFRARVTGVGVDGEMWLVGQANPDNWGFVFLSPGNVRLRKISSPHPGYLHPDGSEAPPRHKHYWTDVDEDRWTYEPTDIRWDNQNLALVDFVRECNITLLHNVPELRFQEGQP